VSHFIASAVSHFISSELHKAWFVLLGLVAWGWAYWFLTRVITPDSIGDLMTLVAVSLPLFSGLIALIVGIASFTTRPAHPIEGAIFFGTALLAGGVIFYERKHLEFWKTLIEILKGVWESSGGLSRRLWSPILRICLGLIGAILVFASELGLVFGGWQFIGGFKSWGSFCAVTGAVISVLAIRPRSEKNFIRKAVIALKGDDTGHSVPFIERLLEADGRVHSTSNHTIKA
jgi:hypothetical protein